MKKFIIFMFIVSLLFISAPCQAIVGQAVSKAAREAVEYTVKKFGINMGGKAGKQFARQAEKFLAGHGDEGIRALKRIGPEVITQTSRHGKDVVRLCASYPEGAGRYLFNHLDEAIPVWRKFGKPGTDLMVKSPGLARPLLNQFGEKGLKLGQKLSTGGLQKFMILASKAKNGPEKTALLEKVLVAGDEVIEFLWKHKVKIGAGVTVYALLKEYETSVVEMGPDGRETVKTTRQSSFIKMLVTAWDKLTGAYPWILLVMLALVIYWSHSLLQFAWKMIRTSSSLINKMITSITKHLHRTIQAFRVKKGAETIRRQDASASLNPDHEERY